MIVSCNGTFERRELSGVMGTLSVRRVMLVRKPSESILKNKANFLNIDMRTFHQWLEATQMLDQASFNSVIKTYSADDVNYVKEMLRDGVKGDKSTTGTFGTPKYLARGDVGVVLDGQVVAAGNGDLFSGIGAVKSPHPNASQVYHARDLLEPPHTPDGLSNEIIVRNGKIVGLVVDMQATKEEKEEMGMLARKYNLPLYNVDSETIRQKHLSRFK